MPVSKRNRGEVMMILNIYSGKSVLHRAHTLRQTHTRSTYDIGLDCSPSRFCSKLYELERTTGGNLNSAPHWLPAWRWGVMRSTWQEETLHKIEG